MIGTFKTGPNPRLLQDAFEELCSDAGEIGLDVFKEFVENRIMGMDASRIATLVGNFGEVIAACLIVSTEHFWFPVYKLRYREKKAWAMRLTDLCLFKVSDVEKPIACFGEVKTRSSDHNPSIGVEGHNSLARDDALEDPEILRFLTQVLYDSDKFDEAKFGMV
jgi:hypothetical protein